ncbi:alpha/beta fold hydrolase [Bradyrhizobium sp.]|jgi:homoserine O-acetyltransferase|uniref:alpha/beta fold hydrolase n=1 Tax=Bradyrhizobium sp. TaxID=376 RepID=UPI003C225451
MSKPGVSASLRTELHSAQAANPQPKPDDAFVELHDFVFDDGGTLASLKLHYLTLGTPRRDASGAIANGVLLLHGTAGSAADLAQAAFFDTLYGAGQPLDLSRYFLLIPDAIGAGNSSKPSDGLQARFPHYGYKDQVRAQHLLLERIGIQHLKLVLGTSMGGMQTWLWGEMFPNDMDCLVAIASTPAAISGRNMIWREMIIQAIRSDPAWNNGDYSKDSPPKNWIKAVIPLSAIMTGSAQQLQKQAPTRKTAIDLVDKLETDGEAYDANDMLYAFESSADYNPAPKLNAIIKPMLTINFADDLTNPPEHLHLPTASNYTEVMIPVGPASYGHMNLAHPAVWASALQSFLQRLPHER